MEGKLIEDDTDKMIHELNEDILYKEEKSLLLHKVQPSFADDDGLKNDRGLRMSFTDNVSHQSPKQLSFKQKNEVAIMDIRLQL